MGSAAVSRKRTVPMLRALAANPGGLTTPELARRFASDVPSWSRALSLCGHLLRKQEAAGYVRVAGTIRKPGRPTIIWQLTDTGRREADLTSTPAGMSGSCFLALATLGGTASTVQVRKWLEAQGEVLTPAQTRGSLASLARRKPPLVELLQKGQVGGRPDVWGMTGHGRALLAEGEADRGGLLSDYVVTRLEAGDADELRGVAERNLLVATTARDTAQTDSEAAVMLTELAGRAEATAAAAGQLAKWIEENRSPL
jgi:hypothetical protein